MTCTPSCAPCRCRRRCARASWRSRPPLTWASPPASPGSRSVAPRWVGDIPARWAAESAARLALTDGTIEHTWRDLDQARHAWAEKLAALGVRPGDRVMVVGENSPAMAMMAFAVTTLRAWIVNVNARLSAREVALIRSHSGARRVLYLTGSSADARTHAAADALAEPLDGGPWGAMAIAASNDAAVAEQLADDPREDVAALLYTTGTTGDPK